MCHWFEPITRLVGESEQKFSVILLRNIGIIRIMPRVDFKLWDRVYILKLICTVQMTFSSFVAILYFYLIVLQNWASVEDDRLPVTKYKWGVIIFSIIDFWSGTLLAVAANMSGIRCRRRIVIWVMAETLLIPTGVFLSMRLYYNIKNSKTSLPTDQHFMRISLVQTGFLMCHFIFIVYAIDYTVSQKPKIKVYDPSIRPKTVHEPTDPQITTTESRHIRMCHSFLFQPTSTKKSLKSYMTGGDNEEASTSSKN